MVKHIIDCDVEPIVPDGWEVCESDQLSSRVRGQLEWDPAKVALYLSGNQQDSGSINGNKLREALKGQRVLNANVLDYLLVNPQLISEEWKGKEVFFWGTIYRGVGGGRCVRFIYWCGDGRWSWGYFWRGHDFLDDGPAAVLASN